MAAARGVELQPRRGVTAGRGARTVLLTQPLGEGGRRRHPSYSAYKEEAEGYQCLNRQHQRFYVLVDADQLMPSI
uniref:Uncharacterized protein n=1 Tax=Leersia perrieri TaxID=77586 RepID=A0A0D9X4Y2_9ORYZ